METRSKLLKYLLYICQAIAVAYIAMYMFRSDYPFLVVPLIIGVAIVLILVLTRKKK
ncbi:hypothetical protein Phi4:1_gp164 [Cellulophaga phage phi4:1]|uniref:Transmembrane protein n=5 Tax=Lightbulbvirus TaxID=1918522 RepID=A0A0S2MWX5_9CAUD|nr:hypothetical protein Phi4:1_gp164 [Cellulophaga phage phi4:1]YP_008241663.1 hypothetical protein Phi17:2_gp168 [Cellulophaga phage phi17:2]ALO80173.1 hypothetical protein Phi4113_164 [Cellulophaga phage phi4:1_13]ALO80370.1 hypothetical protein Phi4118_164 [Cellulophaga phage phi4:1_18]ALO80571.1 hypothetical protein Phi17218_168 [Cellulophaga phage phi17:2_18]AGO47701.1 hypothetical protein Phi17:2_gp168 [Cellulophaga phage phi17:2]AGO49577.1 hypothetical protein Phi4:1_gp164 [Cellulophag